MRSGGLGFHFPTRDHRGSRGVVYPLPHNKKNFKKILEKILENKNPYKKYRGGNIKITFKK